MLTTLPVDFCIKIIFASSVSGVLVNQPSAAAEIATIKLGTFVAAKHPTQEPVL